MSIPNTSSALIPSQSLEQTGPYVLNPNMTTPNFPPQQQIQNSSCGPVAILWDIENCPVPNDVRPEDVAGNIRMALRVHPVIKGAAVRTFSAYGDFNAFPRRLREGCQRTGVKLIDVPNGKKDAADKAILVDIFLFALDNPPPSSIVLISGDVDFSPALHVLGQRGYTIILVIPSRVGVSSALCNAGRFVWDWSSVARGEGFVPNSKFIVPSRICQGEISGYLMEYPLNDISPEAQNEEEAIVYRGTSQTFYNSMDFSMVSKSIPCFSPASKSLSIPSGLNEVAVSSSDQNDLLWAQPGDLNGLSLQLVKLLELSGGCIPLNRIPAEYQRMYRKPLFVADYGAFKLIDLLKKMGDVLVIDEKGQNKSAYLRNSRPVPILPAQILSKTDKKTRKQNMVGAGSSDELSEEERAVVTEEIDDPDLAQFKCELQEIFVSYSCRIFLGCFSAIYQQRYKRPLDYQKFGVEELEELLSKVKDVAILQEEPGTKRKFLVAVGC